MGGRPAGRLLPLTDELELGADVLHEERHVVGEVKFGRGEYERVSEDGGAAQAVHLENVHNVLFDSLV